MNKSFGLQDEQPWRLRWKMPLSAKPSPKLKMSTLLTSTKTTAPNRDGMIDQGVLIGDSSTAQKAVHGELQAGIG